MGEVHDLCAGSKLEDPVFLIENHDQAYKIWRELGLKERTLVHVDAHHDMRWNSR